MARQGSCEAHNDQLRPSLGRRRRVVVCVLAAMAVALGTALPASAIYKGYDANAAGFPYFARIFLRSNFSCGGTLIRQDVVLTAAHCLFDDNGVRISNSVFAVHFATTPSYPAMIVGVRKSFTDNGYLPNRQMPHDVGLLFLAAPVRRPVVQRSAAPAVGTWTTAIGFGCTGNPTAATPKKSQASCASRPATRLQGASLKRVENSYCAPALDRATAMCLDGFKSTVTWGDSGGPALLQRGSAWYQVGIVSHFVTVPESAPYYNVFTSVAAEAGWIDARLSANPLPTTTTAPPTTASTTTATTVPATTVATTTTTAPQDSTVSYDCPPGSNGANNAGHYVPTGYYWNEAFTAQSSTITNGTVLLGANADGNPHVAAVGISTTLGTHTHPANWVGTPDSFQVPGWVVESWTLPSPISVTPGATYYLTVTATSGDFTAFDNTERPLPGEDGCFVGSVVGS